MHFVLDLMLRLKVHLIFHFKEPLKMHRKTREDAFDVALGGALEGAFVGTIEDATEDLS